MANLTLLKRLFGRSEKPLAEPLQGGISPGQAVADTAAQSATRTRMEADVASDRKRRGATDDGRR